MLWPWKFSVSAESPCNDRFKVTGTGKIVRRKGWKSHLLTGKNATRKRRLTGSFEIDKSNKENFQQMVPYGLK